MRGQSEYEDRFFVGDEVQCTHVPSYAQDLLRLWGYYTVSAVHGVYLELEGIPDAHFSSGNFIEADLPVEDWS